MYILVALFGYKKLPAKYVSALLFATFVLLSLFWAKRSPDMLIIYATDMREVVNTGVYFWAGAFIYHWGIKRFFTFEYFTIALLLLGFCYQFAYLYQIVSIFLIPFLVLSFGFSDAKALKLFNKFDYSYGFYIYAFPIQQTIIYLYPKISMPLYLLSTFTITMIFAALSWHFVEKPFLEFKPKKR